MVYIRHRDRMVQESVFNDLKDTLIACRWMAGTTSRPLVSPTDRAAGYQVITTTDDQVLKMAKGTAVTLVDYFPETSDPEGILGQPEKGHTPPNRMAMDDGQPGEAIPIELGSSLCEIPYRFTIAFWGANVGVCQAVLNDLRDRYRGDAVSHAAVPLFDYNADPDATTPVLGMEVDNFSYVRAAIEEIEAHELTLYYAQLTVVDVVDDASVGAPLPPTPPPPPGPGPSFDHVMVLAEPAVTSVDHGPPHYVESVMVGSGNVLGDGDDGTNVVLRSDPGPLAHDQLVAPFTPGVDFAHLTNATFDVRYDIAGSLPTPTWIMLGFCDVGQTTIVGLPPLELTTGGGIGTFHFDLLEYVTGIYGAGVAPAFFADFGANLAALTDIAVFAYIDSADTGDWSTIATIYELTLTIATTDA